MYLTETGIQIARFPSIRIGESDPFLPRIFSVILASCIERLYSTCGGIGRDVTLTVATTKTGSHFTSTGNVRGT